MRIPHWIKNLFVLAPILFAGRFDEVQAWVAGLGALLAFGILSSSVYLVNDICDRGHDRAHPVKRFRPIAAERLSLSTAWVAAGMLLTLGLGVAAVVPSLCSDSGPSMGRWNLLAWASAYFGVNLLYSFWLKRKSIIDVIVIAFGFVIRAMAGAAAINVGVSPWLVICTFSLCLHIALTKRRGEIMDLAPDEAHAARPANSAYSLENVAYMVTVSTAMAILSYSLYCVAPRTVQRLGSGHMVWTIPLVVYGLFRYNRITKAAGTGDPTHVLLHDKVMWLTLLVYALLVGLIVEFGRLGPLGHLLDL